MKKYTFIDLFAGLGGFHLALKKEAECVFASEWDKHARKSYALNFGSDLFEKGCLFGGDVTQVKANQIPAHTILCAGFPCQPFSIAGKQAGFSHPTQGTLFFEIIKIIQHHKPRVVFLENVKNLKTHDGGKTFKTIVESLEKEGYTVSHQILNGTTHGNVPQNRERIFIVAFLEKADSDQFKFPDEIPLTESIKSMILVSKKQESKYYQTDLSSDPVKKIVAGVTKKGVIYQYRRYYVRENKNGTCPTLTANMGGGGHNVPFLLDNFGVRKLTPRECLTLQGFPEDYQLPKISDVHLYKQAGNSVVVPVVRRIAEHIFHALKMNDKKLTLQKGNKK